MSSIRGVTNTAFTPDPDILAQMSGTGNPTPGFTGAAALGAGSSPTFAAAIDVTPFLLKSRALRILGVNATSSTCSLTTTAIAPQGATLKVSCEATGGTVTYTFSTGFKVSGTAAATTGTAMTVEFTSNGANWIESSRSLAITI